MNNEKKTAFLFFARCKLIDFDYVTIDYFRGFIYNIVSLPGTSGYNEYERENQRFLLSATHGPNNLHVIINTNDLIRYLVVVHLFSAESYIKI